MKFNIRLLYLYLFSFVGLLIAVIGSIQLVDLGLKVYVFKVTENTYYSEPKMEGREESPPEELKIEREAEERNQRKRRASNALAMMTVGVPVYLYHWKTIKREK